MHCYENKGINIFPVNISPKVKRIVQLEFKLPYYDVTIRHVNHYNTGTPPLKN